jgi:uncharacterized membrane protein
MNRLELIWTHLRSSFWFLPMLIHAASIVIAVALIEADAGSARRLIDNWPRLFGSGAAGARGTLSIIVRMLEALQRLAARVHDDQRRKSLAEYLDGMMELRDSLGSAYEREQFDATMRGTHGALRR